MKRFLLVILILLLNLPSYSQDVIGADLQQHLWDVFTKRNAANPSLTDVIFVNLLSGDQSTLSAPGERFTLTNSGVIFFDNVERQVKLGKADGIIRDHPFIIVNSETHRVDWAVSADREWIVWTISRRVEDGQLITATWLADVAGAEVRELLVYGPRAGIQLLPIAFGEDQREVFMEAHAFGDDGLSPYRRRTGLFSLVLSEDELVTRALPGDQSCFCAVGFGANRMLRLAPNRELGGLDVEIYRLDGGEPLVIPALSRGNYSEGGNILLSADGTQAVYALSQVGEGADEGTEIRTVLIHVDIENGRQRIVSSPMPGPIRPLSFGEENRAALIAIGQRDSTLKVDLEDGRLIEAAAAVYLGQIRRSLGHARTSELWAIGPIPDGIGDFPYGIRAGDPLGVRRALLQHFRPFFQPFTDSLCHRFRLGQVDTRAVLGHQAHIACFLARDAIADDHRQAGNGGFAYRGWTRFGDDDIGSGHDPRHLAMVADEAEYVIRINPFAILQPRLQFLVAAANHQQLRIQRLSVQRFHHLLYRAHAFPARHQQHGRQLWIEAEFGARLVFCRHRVDKVWVHRQAGNLHLRGRHAQTQTAAVGGFGRHEAMIDARIIPKRRSRDQVGYDSQKWRAFVQREKCAKRRIADDGMGADDDIGRMIGDDPPQDSPVVAIDQLARETGAAFAIEAVIHQGPEEFRGVDNARIQLRLFVERPLACAQDIDGIKVDSVAIANFHGVLNRLKSRAVPAAGIGEQKEDFLGHAVTSRASWNRISPTSSTGRCSACAQEQTSADLGTTLTLIAPK